MAKKKDISIHLSFLLRHRPETIGLAMDRHGWVEVRELIEKVNAAGEYTLTLPQLKDIVAADEKGRYRFSPDGKRIKACQGHSIPWVEPELRYMDPPEFLYHGTTAAAYRKIMEAGHISKMKRHGVHMTAYVEKAWQSARRWNLKPLVLKIAAGEMARGGVRFGCSDNDVWCTEEVPVSYICQVLYE